MSAHNDGGPVDVLALFRGRAQDEEPRVRHTCDMGVGCEEYGVCYAAAHGEPERCARPAVARKPTSDERQGHVDFLSASKGITTAIDHFLAGVDFARASVAALIAERDALVQEVERLQADGVHSCGPHCQRPMCVLRRERDALREALILARRMCGLKGEVHRVIDAALALTAGESA